jgi:hypothetical protein
MGGVRASPQHTLSDTFRAGGATPKETRNKTFRNSTTASFVTDNIRQYIDTNSNEAHC